MTKEKLNNVIELVSSVYKDSMIQICDVNYKFQFMGSKIANLLKIKSSYAIDKNLIEIDCKINKLASQYKQLNSHVMLSKSPKVQYTTYANEDNQTLVIENIVLPIKDKDEVLGIFIESKIVRNIAKINFDIIKNLKNNSYKISYTPLENKINLDNRIEKLVIFLISMGFQDKEIYQLLDSISIKCSSYSVSKLISRKLYPKFNISNRNELIKKAAILGLNSQVPEELFKDHELLKMFLTLLSRTPNVLK